MAITSVFPDTVVFILTKGVIRHTAVWAAKYMRSKELDQTIGEVVSGKKIANYLCISKAAELVTFTEE